ncbi:site-specific integrase [Segetibacter aerophilus]|uniref:Transposase n=1 Tax=Segetibacter aerophilus TaxID=670293 RepID=A0A512BHR3_9BACT|nr:site-specific integrase [Segetibacter aerophilus]GEO11526.1 transposase [Segetibacter aerophilus]
MEDVKFIPALRKDDINKQGTSALVIKVFLNNKLITMEGFKKRLAPVDFDDDFRQVKKSHPNYIYLNKLLKQRISELENMVLEKQLLKFRLTKDKLKQLIKGFDIGVSFSHYAKDMLKSMKGKYSDETIDTYQTELDKIHLFAGSDISFADIDVRFLRKYEEHLRKNTVNSNNTIHKAFKFMKRTFNAANKEGVFKGYPFGDYDCPKYQEVDKEWLEWSEVQKLHSLFNAELTKPIYYVLVHFLIGCHSGLRVSDWIQFNPFKHIKNDRLILRAKKNDELVSLTISPQLKDLLNRSKFIFDHYKYTGKTFNVYLKYIAGIAGIQKSITTHWGRHTFSVHCAETGISKETTAELMGVTVETVEYYYKVTNRKIDKEFELFSKVG